MQEMGRVLCVGGRALVYVWAKDQKKKEMSSYLKQNKKNKDGGDSKESSSRETGEFGLPVHINRFSISNASILKNPFFLQDPVPASRQLGSLEAEGGAG